MSGVAGLFVAGDTVDVGCDGIEMGGAGFGGG